MVERSFAYYCPRKDLAVPNNLTREGEHVFCRLDVFAEAFLDSGRIGAARHTEAAGLHFLDHQQQAGTQNVDGASESLACQEGLSLAAESCRQHVCCNLITARLIVKDRNRRLEGGE